jgi:hypothetical protein
MAQHNIASSTRSSSSRSKVDQEMDDQKSPEKSQQESPLMIKLTSPLPKPNNVGENVDNEKKDNEDVNKGDSPSHGITMEKKMDDLKSTMDVLVTTLATLTTKEETLKASKILDENLIEMKKEILEKQIGTFGDINSKFDTKINEIEVKLLTIH